MDNNNVIVGNDKECTPDLALTFYIKSFVKRKGRRRSAITTDFDRSNIDHSDEHNPDQDEL